ncbi:DUF202 domain-containing protein [Subtercola sp. YIM 133946]|uniref:DUF202 domain-containing protein n=1 Tax=Subtercola sp. YIM 133946 TaxID=3118909 RepID=UPI002F93A137
MTGSPARSLGDAPFDRGLQAERTALAWRRTALSLALGSLAASRVLSTVLGLGSYALGMLGLAAAACFLVSADRRYRRAHASLTSTAAHPRGPRLTSSGTMLLAMMLVALAAGALASVYVLLAALR